MTTEEQAPIVQCLCGGLIDARDGGPAVGVRIHQRTSRHREWLWNGGMDGPSFDVAVHILPSTVSTAAA